MVEPLANDLRKLLFEVWIDFEGIVGGSQWEAEITKALAQADICLVAMTPNAVRSDYVKREIAMARSMNKLVIPLVMEAISLPDDLETLGVADLQYINFTRYGYAKGLAQLTAALPEAKTAPAASHLRALIVEDIPAQQVVIEEVLRSFGLEITAVPNFERALEAIRGEKFDLITLDMQLHEMDTGGQHGMLLLDELRTYQVVVPVIIISALKFSGTRVRDFFREYNAFDYLRKPFKPRRLRTMVENALKKSREHNER
jgi:CheY-like chemotaxis protein